MKDNAKHLPPLPSTEPAKRKSNGSKNGGSNRDSLQETGHSGQQDRKSSKKEGKQGHERKRGKDKKDKYADLPVYNKEEEERKKQQREKEIARLFSDVDKQLTDITDLTTSHMEERTRYETVIVSQDVKKVDHQSTRTSTTSSAADIHTIRYDKGGLLKQRTNNSDIDQEGESKTQHSSHAKCQAQVDKLRQGQTQTDQIYAKSSKNRGAIASTDTSPRDSITEPLAAVSKSTISGKRSDGSINEISMTCETSYVSESREDKIKVSEGKTRETDLTYESLGQTFQDLTDKMEEAARQLDEEIPFIDAVDEGDRRHRHGARHRRSPIQGGQEEIDAAILEAISMAADSLLDLDNRVEKIQLAGDEGRLSGGTGGEALVVAHRRCQGIDTVHLSTKTVTREYRDI